MPAADTLPTRASRPLPASAPPAAAWEAPSIAEVYEANFDYVFRCLRSLGVRVDVLDDAVQDVFMVVQDKLADFDGAAALRTWLYAIALRIARRYRSASATERERFVAHEVESEAACHHEFEHNERLALAQRALAALDDDKREVFVLAQIEQMSAPEIAEITGLPVNTVYSRLRAARFAFNSHAARLRLAQEGRSPR